MRPVFLLLSSSSLLVCAPLIAQEHDEPRTPSHEEHPHHEHVFESIGPYLKHRRGDESHDHGGHASREGYPFVHGLRTEIDFIERAWEFDLVRSSHADNGMVDELEFESELVWAINDHTIVILGAPLISLDPIVEPNTTGMGDLELGLQFLAFGGERDLLFVALNAALPTGDAERDLGTGHTTLEPTALWLHDFGKGTYFQSRFGWEIPVSTTDVGSDFKYDLGLYHTFVGTEHWNKFRYLTPLIEANGITALNEPGHGRTVLDLTTGFRWVVREMDEVGLGWSFPLTKSTNFDNQGILSYRYHF